MFWKKEDGLAVAEIVTLFTLVSIITFSALPYFNNLVSNTHKTNIMSMYNNINTSIMISTMDNVAVKGTYTVPFAHQITKNRIINLKNLNQWQNDGEGTWTYLPTGVQIIYNRIENNDYSLKINYNE